MAGRRLKQMLQTADRRQEDDVMGACVGAPAPDFEASAYDKGSVTKIALGDYRGQWVVLFFYPADFTCV